MEKILSKELLLQNLNSTNMFLVKNCMLYIFEELLKGKQGMLTIQDIVFSKKSEIQPAEFFKNFSIYFAEKSSRNVQSWDNFFNVLEQRRSYMSICRMVVLNMYLSNRLSKKEKHKCCVWLNNHCQLGNHQNLILKMLSYPEDGKLLLLAKKYFRQEAEPSQEELDKVCLLPIRTPRKLEVYSLFINKNNQNFDFCILKELMQNLSDSLLMATGEEKHKMWQMVVGLLQRNPLDNVFLELNIGVHKFNKMYLQGQIDKDIYLSILKIYSEQISLIPNSLNGILDGYTQVILIEKRKNHLQNVVEVLFLLLENKNSIIADKVMLLLLKIISLWKDEMWFKINYLPKFRAKMYQGAFLVEKADIAMLNQSLKIDEQLFLILVSQVEEKDVENVLEKVAYRYSHLWQETMDNILSKQTVEVLSVMKILVELYKKANKDSYKQLFSTSLILLLNNLPEKENVSAKAGEILPFMSDNADLQKLVENYQKSANIAMANYMIG